MQHSNNQDNQLIQITMCFVQCVIVIRHLESLIKIKLTRLVNLYSVKVKKRWLLPKIKCTKCLIAILKIVTVKTSKYTNKVRMFCKIVRFMFVKLIKCNNMQYSELRLARNAINNHRQLFIKISRKVKSNRNLQVFYSPITML